MILKRGGRYGVRVYRDGRQDWIGTYPTRREARAAERAALDAAAASNVTVADFLAGYLARYERTRKGSSTDTARTALRRFEADFGERPITEITRIEAIKWAEKVPPSKLPAVITAMHAAVDAELIERNPFRGLSRRSRGRSDEHPPTGDELARILAACAALGDYAPQMRALISFAAYTGMRPGECFALEWTDIDFQRMRIRVRRRLYRGELDLPKSNRIRTIALTPPARDALLGHPRDGTLVFRAKRGGRLSQPTLSGYWAQVKAAAGVEFDFYLATKHYAVSYLHNTLGLPPRVIAEQMGWTLAGVLKLLAVYGHGDVGALEEIDKAFATNVAPLRAVR